CGPPDWVIFKPSLRQQRRTLGRGVVRLERDLIHVVRRVSLDLQVDEGMRRVRLDGDLERDQQPLAGGQTVGDVAGDYVASGRTFDAASGGIAAAAIAIVEAAEIDVGLVCQGERDLEVVRFLIPGVADPDRITDFRALRDRVWRIDDIARDQVLTARAVGV